MAPILIKVTTEVVNYKQNYLNGDDAEIRTTLYIVFTVLCFLPTLKHAQDRDNTEQCVWCVAAF